MSRRISWGWWVLIVLISISAILWLLSQTLVPN